jgi:hypothetical protein
MLAFAGTLALSSCNEEPAPVKAAKAFASAVQGNNVEAMLGLVDASTVAMLEQAAERASDQIGGRRSVEPEEMLQIVDIDRRFMVAKAELVTQTESTASVRLVGADGSEHVLQLVLEEDEWRVKVPVPHHAPSGADGPHTPAAAES